MADDTTPRKLWCSNPMSVREFMQAAGQTINDTPTLPSEEDKELRFSLLREEFEEFAEAWYTDSLTEVYDALLDMMVIIEGTALTLGLDLERGMREVLRSNSTKINPQTMKPYEGGGSKKVQKGPHYIPPNLRSIVKSPDEKTELERMSDTDERMLNSPSNTSI